MKHSDCPGRRPGTDQKDHIGLGVLKWEPDHAQMRWSGLCQDLDRSGDPKWDSDHGYMRSSDP